MRTTAAGFGLSLKFLKGLAHIDKGAIVAVIKSALGGFSVPLLQRFLGRGIVDSALLLKFFITLFPVAES